MSYETHYETREQWLVAAVELLRPLLKEALLDTQSLGSVRVSCGFPPSAGRKTLGFCTHKATATDGLPQINISPMMGPENITGEQGVLSTLLHEMCHAALPDKIGHRKVWQKLAKRVGLELVTSSITTAPAELQEKLKLLAAKLGPYPHASCNPYHEHKKQGTRMKKCVCPTCGYLCRATHQWLDTAGAPICPTDREQMEIEE